MNIPLCGMLGCRSLAAAAPLWRRVPPRPAFGGALPLKGEYQSGGGCH